MRFKPCNCGSTEFYMLQRISGNGNFYVDTDGLPTKNNVALHDNLEYKDMRKHYRCSNCDKIAKEVKYD